jgi:hypothetical protein
MFLDRRLVLSPAVGRRPTSPQRDSPAFVLFVTFVAFVFAVSPCSSTAALHPLDMTFQCGQ